MVTVKTRTHEVIISGPTKEPPEDPDFPYEDGVTYEENIDEKETQIKLKNANKNKTSV